MQKLSNIKYVKILSRLLVLLLIAKVISTAVWWYLPSEGVELSAQKSYQPKYQRVSFANMLKDEVQSKGGTQAEASGDMSRDAAAVKSVEYLVLKGLYGSRFDGYIIIAKKSALKDTSIISVGEEYAGYKLKEIELKGVILTKGGKEYRLSLEDQEEKHQKAITKARSKSKQTSNLVEDVAQKEVTREDIKTYSNNPSLIWKDIGIKEVMEGKKIAGFKVTRVRAGSKMETLGLQSGDLIIKANNIPLTSINDVLKLYKDIEKIDTLALTILRENQEKEIIYEIH